MYKQIKHKKSSIHLNQGYTGECLEVKILRLKTNKEGIPADTQPIYTERKDGVLADFDIKADRMESAVELADLRARYNTAMRQMAIGDREFDTMTDEQQKEHLKNFPTSKHAKKESGA